MKFWKDIHRGAVLRRAQDGTAHSTRRHDSTNYFHPSPRSDHSHRITHHCGWAFSLALQRVISSGSGLEPKLSS